MSSTYIEANFEQVLQFHLVIHCSHFISGIAFVSPHVCFKRILAQVITLVTMNFYIYVVFTTKGFLEVAIESWAQWDLNLWLPDSVQTR